MTHLSSKKPTYNSVSNKICMEHVEKIKHCYFNLFCLVVLLAQSYFMTGKCRDRKYRYFRASSFNVFENCTSTWYHHLFGIQGNWTISFNFIEVGTYLLFICYLYLPYLYKSLNIAWDVLTSWRRSLYMRLVFNVDILKELI